MEDLIQIWCKNNSIDDYSVPNIPVLVTDNDLALCKLDIRDFTDWFPIHKNSNGSISIVHYYNLNKKSLKHGKVLQMKDFLTGNRYFEIIAQSIDELMVKPGYSDIFVTEEYLINKFNEMLKKVPVESDESSDEDDNKGPFCKCTQKDLNNRFFNSIVGKPQVSLNFIQYMVDNGVDPRSGITRKDDGLIEVCKSGSVDKIKYFIEKFNSDINAQKGDPLFVVIHYNKYDAFELMMQKGCEVTYKHIRAMSDDSRLKYVEFLIKSGYDSKLFVNGLMKFLCETYLHGNQLVKYLVNENVDFNETIKNL